MAFKFFTLPVRYPADVERELNQFLATHRILAVERHFYQDESGEGAWSLCVEYYEITGQSERAFSGSKVDYKEVLKPDEFEVYSKLRAIRKEAADAEKVPPFALFNNEQLAEMVQKRVSTRRQLSEIKGIGESRLEKYGALILKVLEKEYGSSGKSDKTQNGESEGTEETA